LLLLVYYKRGNSAPIFSKRMCRVVKTLTAAVRPVDAEVKVGEYVLAMGSPMALSQSVTLGIISNTEMTMPRFWGPARGFQLDGEDVGALVRWIGHDAAIYGGNSGGPLVNLRGKIIGINEISYGLSGAIPGNLAKNIAEQIMAKGRVQRSWFGLDLQPLFKRSADKHGVLVSGVIEHSPADKAGFKPGDVLLRLDGAATDVRFEEQMADVMWQLAGLAIGHPYSTTLEALTQFLPQLEKRDVQLVPVSHLLRLPEVARMVPPRRTTP